MESPKEVIRPDVVIRKVTPEIVLDTCTPTPSTFRDPDPNTMQASSSAGEAEPLLSPESRAKWKRRTCLDCGLTFARVWVPTNRYIEC